MNQYSIIKNAVILSLVILFTAACSSTGSQEHTQPTKTGLQLWADNCSFCHNHRAIDSYSDAEWDVVMMHMRIRANLTANDARAITEYLKTAN